MHCPTKDDTLAVLLALLPRGRAWQNHEGGPEPYHDAAFDKKTFDPEVFDTESRKGSTLYRFWEAAAHVLTFANERLCALALEMFCATQTETRDQWMQEYGLPDPCDPFPDLCDKVAALGGSRCEYFAEVAARAGWGIDCIDGAIVCGLRAGRGRAGCDRAGSARSLTLKIVVYVSDSPAFTGRMQTPPRAGRLRAGRPLACAPRLDGLRCIIDRIAPAHVAVSYVAI